MSNWKILQSGKCVSEFEYTNDLAKAQSTLKTNIKLAFDNESDEQLAFSYLTIECVKTGKIFNLNIHPIAIYEHAHLNGIKSHK